jgi:hypothetical protein
MSAKGHPGRRPADQSFDTSGRMRVLMSVNIEKRGGEARREIDLYYIRQERKGEGLYKGTNGTT